MHSEDAMERGERTPGGQMERRAHTRTAPAARGTEAAHGGDVTGRAERTRQGGLGRRARPPRTLMNTRGRAGGRGRAALGRPPRALRRHRRTVQTPQGGGTYRGGKGAGAVGAAAGGGVSARKVLGKHGPGEKGVKVKGRGPMGAEGG